MTQISNRLKRQSDPDTGNWQYQYNAAGELIRQIDGKGQVTEMDYDAARRMWRRKAIGVPVVRPTASGDI